MSALLRELIERSGTAMVSIDERLGWEPGRLGALLDGPQGVSFEVLLEVLPTLDETPGDFFARLCGFHPESRGGFEDRVARADHRFEESRRVVKAAIARRLAWKQEQAAAPK